MDFTQSRFFRMHGQPTGIEALSQAIADLRYTLFSAIQDIAVLKEALRGQGLLGPELYKKLRTERMLADHSSAGASPWEHAAAYSYSLDEEDFLRREFRASEDEVRAFKDAATSAGELT